MSPQLQRIQQAKTQEEVEALLRLWNAATLVAIGHVPVKVAK